MLAGGRCRQASVLVWCAGLTWSTLPALDWLGVAAWIEEGADMALLRTKQCAHMKEPKSTVFPVQSEPIYSHTSCPLRQCVFMQPTSSCNPCVHATHVFMQPTSAAPVNTGQRKTGPDRATPTSMYKHPEVALQDQELPILACGNKFHAELTCMTKQLMM